MRNKRHPWFLPAEDDEVGPAPFGRRLERLLFGPVEWRDAEGALAALLAALAYDAGRLTERLEAQAGGVERLALQEAASLSWWSGDRIGAVRLGLWLALRLGATGEVAPGAAWAARRLAALRIRAGDWPAVIRGFGADGWAVADHSWLSGVSSLADAGPCGAGRRAG